MNPEKLKPTTSSGWLQPFMFYCMLIIWAVVLYFLKCLFKENVCLLSLLKYFKKQTYSDWCWSWWSQTRTHAPVEWSPRCFLSSLCLGEHLCLHIWLVLCAPLSGVLLRWQKVVAGLLCALQMEFITSELDAECQWESSVSISLLLTLYHRLCWEAWDWFNPPSLSKAYLQISTWKDLKGETISSKIKI